MKNRAYIFVLLTMILLMTSAVRSADADSESDREHQVKAAFLYNFLKFVDWSPEKVPDNNEPIIIGVVNPDGFSRSLENIKGRKVKGKEIIIKYFKGLDDLYEASEKDNLEWFQELEVLKKCHILFFYDCPKKNPMSQITKALEDSSVLTVGQVTGFLENGGNINFILEDGKVRFEINLISTKQNNLKISSKLLKLAKKVVK